MTSTGLHAQLACLWEATARQPGNVHRFRDFDDLSYLDFVLSDIARTAALPALALRLDVHFLVEFARCVG